MKTILYLEDNADDVYLLRRALDRAGLGVRLHVTTTPEETVAYIHGNPPYEDRTLFPWPDLVLVDIHIPGDDGFEVLRRLSQEPAEDTPRIILVSDNAAPAHARQAEDLGAHEFFIKPRDHDQWAPFLRQLLFTHDAATHKVHGAKY